MVKRPAPEDTGSEQDPNAVDTGSTLDSSNGDEDNEQAEPDFSGETPAPSDEDLDAIDEIEAGKVVKADQEIVDAETKFLRIAAAYPSTTPDSFTIFGYGEIKITLGDLRNLAIGLRDKYRG